MPVIRAARGARSVDPKRLLRRRENVNRRQFVVSAAALTLAPRALATRFGGAPAVYVTADLESHVVVLDLASAEVIGRIRTGPGPRSVESVHGRLAVVAHTEHRVVSVLDAATHRLRAEIDGFAEPRYTAVHPRLPLAYVTDSAREEIVVLHADRRRVLGRTSVPGPARHVSISRDGRTLWAALGTKAARVAVLDTSDPRRPRLASTFAPPFLAHDVAFAPDGRTVWVSSGDEWRLALYGRDRRLRRVIAAGSPPQHVTFARDKAFVAAGDDGTVRRHRLDGAFVREARVPGGSYNVTFGWGQVVTPSLGRGTLSVLDADGRVRGIQTIARAAHDACIVFGP
jgi:DNA-binding beta-propeller fold protein YncE